MYDISTTQRVIEDAQYEGVHAFGSEIEDKRGVPSEKELANLAIGILETLDEAIAETALEWDRDQFLWSMVNSFHHLAQRYSKEEDANMRKIRALSESQDGSEIQSGELEQAQMIGERVYDKLRSAEALRDGAAAAYSGITGNAWMPTIGSRPIGPVITGSVINARDYLNAKERAKTQRFIPEGTLMAVSGHGDRQDHHKIWNTLDKVLNKYPDLVLLTTGGRKGADLIIGKWATSRGVNMVFFTPNFKKYGKDAPNRRNQEITCQKPKGLIVFPSSKNGNGIIDNLVGHASKNGVNVWKVQ